jgi:GTP diphosphokinase / guanosine-3',5'-bis(diphosphate) 3'-diphosphatase
MPDAELEKQPKKLRDTEHAGTEVEILASADLPQPKELGTGIIRQMQRYMKQVDEQKIHKAIDFAVTYHGSQKRHSGDPYFYHPIAVANMLATMKLDEASIITAILHDTIEDTEATLEQLTGFFGEEVANLVEGVTKLTQIEFQSESDKQAENYRKFLLASSKDIRVLVVKLADRLHNMRTLHYIKKPEKRARIARETMEIYAPLAERIGMSKIKEELQDIAFQELNTEAYQSIRNRLEYLRNVDAPLVGRILSDLRAVMEKWVITCEVTGREKTPYSIWSKMQKKNISFEQLSDIIAFRIITNDVQSCYASLGCIHSEYHAIPEQFKDYISTPKNNGYQSIHTVVLGPEQHRIEIQIRSREMNDVAENGLAAHWLYKQGNEFSTEGKQFQWLRSLVSIMENVDTSEEFLENTRMEMYQDQVFCFTPRGDLIVLPQGATPVDFAFAVHSEVGRTCVGAKVNGKIMPLRTQLQNGDQVEILQSKSQNPSPSWEHFVVTGKALSEVRKYIRQQQSKEYQTLGREILEKLLKQEHIEWHESMAKQILERFGKKKMEDVYIALGEGTIQRNEVAKVIIPDKKKSSGLLQVFRRHKPKKSGEQKAAIPIRGLIPGMAIHFAGCCHPLPGEKIVGIVNTGKGVTIHTRECSELQSFINMPERWLDVAWDDEAEETAYIGRIRIVLHHKAGALAELANTIAHSEGNINNLRITSRSSDFFEMIVDVDVKSAEHLEKVMALLRSKPVIHSVERFSEGRESLY